MTAIVLAWAIVLAQVFLVLAMACVDYRPITGHIVGSAPFHLKDALALRPRQNLTLDCANC